MLSIPLTVIVPVKNEALNIEACLDSICWADQIFVVDSQSNDRTCEIAEKLGAEVVQFHYDGGWPKKKNWAIKTLPIRNEWIFILDADERVSPELREEIKEGIKCSAKNGYYVRWKFIFLGKWMKHSWSHGWMLRLFRKGTGEYEDLGMRGEGGWDNEVHENIIVRGNVGRMRSPLIHETKQDLSFWIQKQNEFSDWNAARRLKQLNRGLPPLSWSFAQDPLKRRRFMKQIFLHLPGKPVILFFYLYFIKMGFLDGLAGFYFCSLRATHELNTCAKLYELKHVK